METICPEGGATGFSCDGGYAEYMVARADFVGLIPDGVDLVRIAPILCAGVTTHRGLRRSEARAGEFVAIIGAGGLGHVAVQYARVLGFRPIVLDVDPAKLDLARRLGAEAVVEAGPDATGIVTALTGGGAAAAIVTAPAPAAFEQSLALIRPGGTAVFIGLPGGGRDAIRLSIAAISNWEKSIRGSNVGTRQDLQEAVDFAARGLVAATVETVPFDQVNEALARLRRGEVLGRLVLDSAGRPSLQAFCPDLQHAVHKAAQGLQADQPGHGHGIAPCRIGRRASASSPAGGAGAIGAGRRRVRSRS